MKEKHPFIVCLKETKLQVCYDGVCSWLWDMQSMAYSVVAPFHQFIQDNILCDLPLCGKNLHDSKVMGGRLVNLIDFYFPRNGA